MLLAIETSCDETAVTLLDYRAILAGAELNSLALKAEIISSQAKLHQAYGGVVPELAAREHIANLPIVLDQAYKKAGISADDVEVIAVTRGPGLKGSLLVGLAYAKGFALAKSIPLLALNHLEGHLFAGELLGKTAAPEIPTLALLVSGGHTLLVLISGFRKYQIIAATRDDAAGEAFDKTATLLGLPYPGGPALSACAIGGDPKRFSFPIALPGDPNSFSFSGLKTAVSREVAKLGTKIEEEALRRDFAASVEQAIVSALVDKVLIACEKYNPKSVLLTGGVAANRLLRGSLENLCQRVGVKFCVPPHIWCTDNASMIAALAINIIQRAPEKYLNWENMPQLNLGPEVTFDVTALSRWSLDEIR